MKNRKHISIVFILVLLISVACILLINAKPELIQNWNVATQSIVKQYCKLIGFLSVMALVFLRFKSSGAENIEEENR